MQRIYTARDEMDASFLKGILAEEEIEAVVEGASLQETWGDLNLSPNSLPAVWVKEEDVAKAAPIVEEYKTRDRAGAVTDELAARPTWKCPQCGEKVEEQFTQCWHCGHSRPSAETAVT